MGVITTGGQSGSIRIAIGESSAARGRRHTGTRYTLGALAGAASGPLPHTVLLICRAPLSRELEVLLVRRTPLRRDLWRKSCHACLGAEEPGHSLGAPASLPRHPVLLDADIRDRGSRYPDALQPLHHGRHALPLFAGAQVVRTPRRHRVGASLRLLLHGDLLWPRGSLLCAVPLPGHAIVAAVVALARSCRRSSGLGGLVRRSRSAPPLQYRPAADALFQCPVRDRAGALRRLFFRPSRTIGNTSADAL